MTFFEIYLDVTNFIVLGSKVHNPIVAKMDWSIGRGGTKTQESRAKIKRWDDIMRDIVREVRFTTKQAALKYLEVLLCYRFI